MNSRLKSIKIPIANSQEYVEIFPDELPEDVNDVLDVLKAELAPLKIWRAVAVEYYRQGEYKNFEAVLSEIVSTMHDDPTVEQYYREKGEYKEGIVEIFDALAAYALDRSVKSIGETEKKREVANYIQKAESINQRNEYTWLIKGFFELAFGNIDNAEYSLKNVYERATAKSTVQRSDKNLSSSQLDKKVFLFASLLGLGTLAFIRKKYSTALDYFSKALHQNSKCGANVRVAIASCTFKLEQYDRTRLALDRALALDPTNVDALVLLSLVERVESQKTDKKKRHEYRALANELCTLAAHIDPTCAMALNHLANYSFYQWQLVHPSGYISSPTLIVLNSTKSHPINNLTLKEGDMIQIQKAFVTTVSSVIRNDNTYEITLGTDVPLEWVGQSTIIEMKDISKINEVKTLTTRAIRASNNPNIKAESFYIFGRLYHMIRDYEIAFQLYEEALNLQPDMPLASFGLGQLCMAKQDYALALEKFNSVLVRHPDDRDTQAYVMLLQSIHKKESTSFDKLREIAPGFAFEADLWLSQGHTIQMKGPGEYQTALKCYEMAYECMNKQNLTPQSKMLLNMGILYHSLGHLTTANDFVRRSLSPNLIVPNDDNKLNPIFHRPENDIFYRWTDEHQLTVQLIDNENNLLDNEIQNHNSGHGFQLSSYQLIKLVLSNDSNVNSFLNLIQVGDDILVSDILLEVLHIQSDYIICKGFHTTLKRNISHKVSIKKPESNFNNTTLTNCFALARIQEDRGHIQAAREIYLELLKLRPTFIECYLRLSLMAKEIGKFHEANNWVSMALEIDPNHADSIIVQGDLAALSEKWDLAKVKYEKICKQRHHDARALLSLGNIYYANASVKESSLKDSMKFYHMVLKEDHRNIYAANGLGMVCASKEQNDIARDIFSRVRETGMSPASDVCVNLGHMHMTQGRFVDAIHIYLAALKSLPLSPAVRLQSEVIADVSDCLALSYLKNSQHDDAIRIILKSIHYNPSSLHVWFNLACVKEEFAVKLCKTVPGSINDIRIAIEELEHATVLFKSLKNTSLCPGAKRHELLHVQKAGQHEKFCLDGIEKAKNKLHKAQVETERKEQIRLKQAEENRQRLASKQAEKLKEEEAKKLSRLEQQELAKQKEKEFEELRKTWVITSGSEKKSDKRKKKQSKNSNQEGDGGDDDDVQESGENENNETKSGYVFSDSEPEAADDDDNDNEADVFGSSSEDEGQNSNNKKNDSDKDNNDNNNHKNSSESKIINKKNLKSNKNVDLFDSDDDDDDDDVDGIFNDVDNTTSTSSSQNNGNLRGKRSANDMNESNADEDNLFETSNESLPQKQRRIIDDDEDEADL